MDALIKRNKRLLKEELFSDMTFVFTENDNEENITIKAHKSILAASSSIFHSIFTEVTSKKNELETKIYISDVSSSTLKLLLQYIYTNEEPRIDESNWASILYVSEKYDFPTLTNKCKEFVEAHCHIGNAWSFFILGRKHHVVAHVPSVKTIIALNAETSLTSDSLLDIPDTDSLFEILSHDEMDCNEILVFRAALKWASARIVDGKEDPSKLRAVLGKAVQAIRFLWLSSCEFNNEVVPKGILTDKEIVGILKSKKDLSILQYDCSRIRSLERFKKEYSCTFRTKLHSIRFKVDCQMKIFAYGIYIPASEENSLEGKMKLKQTKEEIILGEQSFKIHHCKKSSVAVIWFANPISINKDTLYTCSIEFDSTHVKTRWGLDGQSKVSMDRVKWFFEDDHHNDEETNVLKGQIPLIKYCKVH